MKVGDLALDTYTKDVLLIINNEPIYIDKQSGEALTWDFEVMSGFGIYYIDADELEAFNEGR